MVRLSRAILIGLGVGAWAICAQTSSSAVEASRNSPRPTLEPTSSHTQSPSSDQPNVVSPQRGVLNRYCVTCHNNRLKTAGLMLDEADVEHVSADAQVWEKVVRKLRSGTMPPAGLPRPDKATYHSLATWLEAELDRATAAAPDPGRAPIHRLTRTEYANAIRDLLTLETDVESQLPPDDTSGYGFDNIGELLSVSPLLLERYMIAAQKISRLAVGDAAMRPVIATYRFRLTRVQEERMSDDLPFGSRGGGVISHHFPLDGEYVLKMSLYRVQNTNIIRGLDNREELDVRLDGARIKLFEVGGECVGSTEPRCVPYRGVVPSSEYDRTADTGLEVRFPVKAGTRQLAVTFIDRRSSKLEGADAPRAPAGSNSFAYDRNAEMSVEIVQISGPFAPTGPGETPSRQEIFVCHPSSASEEEPCAAEILARLARKAYRRPVTDQDVQPLLGFYRAGRAKGEFEVGIEAALRALLVAPEFLFRVERPPANVAPSAAYRISDVELASRLSFFLWSSIPDDELLDVAERRKLSDPAVLEQQVRRMLDDARATALVRNFAGQWLYLRNLRGAVPDPTQFPEFDDNLREAFTRETELFFESQLREDRSVFELLTANYTFVNERLARFYQIPNVYGDHFRRVTFGDERRAGLLGQASILTITSYSHRTSPVVRGKWLLENVLGAPPPAPPANVPPLKEENKTEPATMRERMEQHRSNAVCASCHRMMDPLGFALENFNAIGKWRASDAGAPIDATGVLPDGTQFDGPVDFRAVLMSHRGEFARTVTEKLLTFALGRGVEYYDMPVVRQILRQSAPTDHSWSSLILEIVKSAPFQMRRAES